ARPGGEVRGGARRTEGFSLLAALRRSTGAPAAPDGLLRPRLARLRVAGSVGRVVDRRGNGRRRRDRRDPPRAARGVLDGRARHRGVAPPLLVTMLNASVAPRTLTSRTSPIPRT